jgi:hypothetical protein
MDDMLLVSNFFLKKNWRVAYYYPTKNLVTIMVVEELRGEVFWVENLFFNLSLSKNT